MFRKLLLLIGLGGATAISASADSLPTPYPQKEMNTIYNLLFCDEASIYRPEEKSKPTPWQDTLFSEKPNIDRIRSLAESQGEESRIRLLAYNWLRKSGDTSIGRELLGVVIEVPLEGGLDVLAVYRDGRIRYINQSGKLSVYEESPSEMAIKVNELLLASEAVVKMIGPWDKPRLPAPSRGNIRMTFLVSDGLYFGEGPFAIMQREPMASPVINRATELLQLVVKGATE